MINDLKNKGTYGSNVMTVEKQTRMFLERYFAVMKECAGAEFLSDCFRIVRPKWIIFLKYFSCNFLTYKIKNYNLKIQGEGKQGINCVT